MESAPTIDRPDSCTCDEDTGRTISQSYTLAPANGGGWTAWTSAFARLLVRLAIEPTHCILVTQEPNQRYVQLMIGHGHAHVEASSNGYLHGDFRLTDADERLLVGLGFRDSAELDATRELPNNWWFDQEDVDPMAIADILMTVMIAVMAFDVRVPILIEVFGASAPCDACFWAASS